MPDLPDEFVRRMKRLLADEWELFRDAGRMERKYGLRVNRLKISPQEFEQIAPFPLTKIPWIPNGYYVSRGDDPAGHPFYAAGLYYLQEPSAMTPASRLKVEPGDKVLDLCAAPGGKATELAACLAGEGLLVANDINRARARALLRNLELAGVKNSMVTNEPPHVLCARFPGYFDKIMVDAPCSGEGMFRKNPGVMESWKEKGPAYFSALQKEIILHGADMLKPGGLMLYSTCTFAPEEDEGVITHLLAKRPQMQIIAMEDYEGFRPGILSFDGQVYHDDCRLCRRIWPHHMEGEGHFMALLKKKEDAEVGMSSPSQIEGRKSKQGKRKDRFRDKQRINQAGKSGDGRDHGQSDVRFLESFLEAVHWQKIESHLDIRGDKVYYVPDPSLTGCRLQFLRNGVYLGELKKNRFEPSEPFALALSAEEYDYRISFPADDERLRRYLKGESFSLDQMTGPGHPDAFPKKGKDGLMNGWVLILAEGYPVSWGKITGHTIKNKYPPAWRKNE